MKKLMGIALLVFGAFSFSFGLFGETTEKSEFADQRSKIHEEFVACRKAGTDKKTCLTERKEKLSVLRQSIRENRKEKRQAKIEEKTEERQAKRQERGESRQSERKERREQRRKQRESESEED